ncbi:MAG: TonB-dependent receptor [Candidatus Alcyoniella australis]|nr:TonB-dependent receptor [Candidatus Alcyoniella australis]
MRIGNILAIVTLCILVAAAAVAGDDLYRPWSGGLPEVTSSEFDAAYIQNIGARNLAQLLAAVPGMMLHEGDFHGANGESHVMERSRPTGEVQVLLDGIPLLDPYSSSLDLADVSLANIERVQVVRSAASPLAGPGGEAALVYLWTKPGLEGYHGGVQMRYGYPEQSDVALDVGFGNRGLSSRVIGAHHDSTGFMLPQSFETAPRENGGIREQSYRNNSNAWAKLGYRFNPNAGIDASGGFCTGDRGVPVGLAQHEPLWRAVEDHTRWHARLGGELLGDVFSIGGNLAVLHERQRVPQYTRPNRGLRIDNERYGFTRTGGSIYPVLDLGRYSRLSGMAAFWLEDSTLIDFRTRDTRFVTAVQAYALEDAIRPHESLLIAVGGGVETNQGLFSEILELPPMMVMPRGRLMLRWQPWGSLALVLGASHQQQAPDQRQLLDPDQGNNQLKPERFDRIEAGLDFGGTEMVSVGFRTYLLAARDLIRPRASSGRFHNGASAGATGIEVELGLRPLNGLSLNGWLNWTVSSERPAGQMGQGLPYAPQLGVGGRAGYLAPFGLGAQIAARYYSEFSDRPEPQAAEQQRQLLPERLIADARLFWRHGSTFEVYIESTNLFDTYYETTRKFPEPGRAYGAGLRLSY